MLKINRQQIAAYVSVRISGGSSYLSSQGDSYAGKEFLSAAAEDGGLIVGYDVIANFSLNFLGPISLNILRKGGGSDVAIPVNLMMHNTSVGEQYASCTIKLLDALREKFDEHLND